MADYSFIASGQASGINGGTVTDLDTTGADLILIHVAEFNGGTHVQPTDSNSNNWNELTTQDSVSIGGFVQSTMWYAKNCISGSGHDFDYASTGSFSVIQVLAFSGSHLTNPFDMESGAVGIEAALSPGAINPSEGYELFATGFGVGDTTGLDSTIDSGFIKELETIGTATNYYAAFAYKISTSWVIEFPTWTFDQNDDNAATMACFRKAADAVVGQFVGRLFAAIR